MERKIKSLEQYVKRASKFKSIYGLSQASINPWFRGHGNRKYELIPSLYRPENEALKNSEREVLRDFKLKSLPYIERNQPQTDIECLAIMQHFGIPTRLLDWSESYLVALFFAVENTNNMADASVWVMNPWELNTNNPYFGLRKILSPNNKELNDWILNDEQVIEPESPIAIRTSMNSNRIVGQKGFFTIHGKDINSLNSSVNCTEIIINGKDKLNLLKELYEAGIRHSTIYPELTGICKEIAFRYSAYLGEDKAKWNDPRNWSQSISSPANFGGFGS